MKIVDFHERLSGFPMHMFVQINSLRTIQTHSDNHLLRHLSPQVPESLFSHLRAGIIKEFANSVRKFLTLTIHYKSGLLLF